MKTKTIVLGLVLGLGGRAMAAPATGTPVPQRAGTLSFFHWFTSPSETSALDALVALFKAKYPGVALKLSLTPGRGGENFPILKNAVASKQPPDSFLMYPGYAAQPFLEAHLLGRIDQVWSSEKLAKAIPDSLQQMSKLDGKSFYAIPFSIHRKNLIWYNKAVLAKHKIDPAALTTWEAFFDATKKLRAAGMESPVQMGAAWTAIHAFECILASLGPAAYEDWLNGKIRGAEDARMIEALTVFKQYLSYANKDHARLDWDKALKRVIDGQSAFCTMGDWADGEFRIAGLEYGKDYGALLVPQTKGMYGVTLDAFVQPFGIADPLNSERWLKFVASSEGQDAFNVVKGSIPARLDANVAGYAGYQKSAMTDFKAATIIYPGAGVGTPIVYKTQFDKIIPAFTVDLDVNRAAAALAAATQAAAGKYTRLWSLK